VSPATRFDAAEENVTTRQFAETFDAPLLPFACPPPVDTETRTVEPAAIRSLTAACDGIAIATTSATTTQPFKPLIRL
jgi:hypothetical protein